MSIPDPRSATHRAGVGDGARRRWVLSPRYVGWFFLWTSGIHVGIVAADPGFYRHFADGALVPGLADAWSSTFVAHGVVFGLLVAAGEASLALMLLGPWRWRRVGWIGVIGFHVALMCFGWGFWMWSVPALALLVLGGLADRRAQIPGALTPERRRGLAPEPTPETVQGHSDR